MLHGYFISRTTLVGITTYALLYSNLNSVNLDKFATERWLLEGEWLVIHDGETKENVQEAKLGASSRQEAGVWCEEDVVDGAGVSG